MTDEHDPDPTIEDLLALIHRDGGHYLDKHGIRKAFDDAVDIVMAGFSTQDGYHLWRAEWTKICVQSSDEISELKYVLTRLESIESLKSEICGHIGSAYVLKSLDSILYFGVAIHEHDCRKF